MKIQIKIDWTLIILCLSVSKRSKWSLIGHVFYFQAMSDSEVTTQEDGWPLGSSFDDLIHRLAGNELVSLSFVSCLIPEFLGGLRATGNMECIPDSNIMALIDQLKFSWRTVLECTHSFSVCDSLRSKITSLDSSLHT